MSSPVSVAINVILMRGEFIGTTGYKDGDDEQVAGSAAGGHLECLVFGAAQQRDDWGFGGGGLEAQLDDSFAEMRRELLQAGDSLWFALQDL